MSARQMYAAEKVRGHTGIALATLRYMAYHSNDYGGCCYPTTIPDLSEVLGFDVKGVRQAITQLEKGNDKKGGPAVLDFKRGSSISKSSWQLQLPSQFLHEYDMWKKSRDIKSGRYNLYKDKVYANHSQQLIDVLDAANETDEIVDIPEGLKA